MKEERIKEFIGRKCLIILQNKFTYFGTIKEVDTDSTLILDKYEALVSLNNNLIEAIIEQTKKLEVKDEQEVFTKDRDHKKTI